MKKGFTLIELMVVIVIIGILAAIAVPKMFGMSAKAKAAEVGPAAGSWSKVMAAYILEKAEIGTWQVVGYTPPGTLNGTTQSYTANFKYADLTGASTLTASMSASPSTKLNNCAALAGYPAAASGASIWNVKYVNTATIPAVTIPTDINCSSLTPNFSKLQ